MIKDSYVHDSTFFDGESPLKHSKNIYIENCNFKWKYPIWYSNNLYVKKSYFDTNARAGIWYTENIELDNCLFDAPKLFRRSKHILINNSIFTDSKETFWECEDIMLNDIKANNDYFCMNSKDIKIDNLLLNGNYPFDGCKNVSIKNSVLNSKDSFWNCENVCIENSKILGEYFGWNSKNVVLKNCHIESLQGFCFIDDLKLINCTLDNTTLAFEYSNVDCEINSKVGSIKNPSSGTIICKGYDELIMEEDKVDINKTKIIIK